MGELGEFYIGGLVWANLFKSKVCVEFITGTSSLSWSNKNYVMCRKYTLF